MVGPLNRKPTSDRPSGATRRTALGLMLGAPLLSALRRRAPSSRAVYQSVQLRAAPTGPPQQPQAVGTGQVKVGLILPLSGAGNAGIAAQSMKNAAEMALAEFQNPNVQLLVKDDGGTPARRAAGAPSRRSSEGAEIILGPLFAQSVRRAAQAARGTRHSGDRVLDRFQRRRPRRLSPELPAGIRRQPHRRLRRRHRQALVRGAAAGQRLRQCGRGRVQAGGRRARGAASSRSRSTAPTAPRRRATVAQALRPGRCAASRRRWRSRSWRWRTR